MKLHRSILLLALATAPTLHASESERTFEAHPVALMPRGLTSFGAAESGGFVYVAGGYFGTPHHYSMEGQSHSFARFNVASGDWEELGPIEGVQGTALVAHGGALYLLGGSRALNAAGEETRMVSVADCARFDPLRRVWTSLAPLPEGRSSHDACVLGSTVYVAGGWTQREGEEPRFASEMLALDLDEEGATWRPIELPFARRALAAASAGGRVVLLGGISPDHDMPSRVDVFDPSNGAWSQGPEFPGPAFAAAAVGVRDTVYASGRDGVVYAWTLGEGAWRATARLAFPRMFHRLVAVADDELVALGGILGMVRDGRTRHVEAIPLTEGADARLDSIASFALPAPGRAKNRQVLFVRGDSLYAFGGNQSREQHDFAPEAFLAEGFRLHLASLDWTPLAPLPEPRQSMGSCVASDGSQALALGGFGHDGEVARTLAGAFAYDFDADAWSAVEGGLQDALTQFGLFEQGSELWIAGGMDYDPRRAKDARFVLPRTLLHASVEGGAPRFEPAGGLELPGTRRAFGSATLDGRCYLVGGMREGFEPVEECDVLDLATKSWERIPGPRRVRISPELVALEGRLYLVGGSSRRAADGELEPDPSIEVYDPATRAWSVLLEELPFEPLHLRAFAYEGRLLLYTAQDPERDLVHLALVDVARAARRAPASGS